MPIYEYQCEKCGHHLEALQKISDKPLRECPECGKHKLIRLMSAPRFRLAGSGWYETDFKSDKESKRNLVEKGDPEPAKTEVKTEAKSEAKTEAKSETRTEAPAETGSDSRPAAKPAAAPAQSRSRTVVTQPAAKSPARARPKSPARKRSPARGKKR